MGDWIRTYVELCLQTWKKNKNHMEIPIIVCWEIWKTRNREIFDGQLLEMRVLCHKIIITCGLIPPPKPQKVRKIAALHHGLQTVAGLFLTGQHKITHFFGEREPSCG